MKILITDDEQVIRDSLESYLSQDGYECKTCEDGHQALSLIPEMEPEVVITDFNMPGMNGIELLKTIKDRFPEIHVIVLTGFADVDNAINAVNLGAYAFFRKPMNMNELSKTLNEIKADHQEVNREKEVKLLWTREYIQLRGAYNALLQEVRKLQSEVHNEPKR